MRLLERIPRGARVFIDANIFVIYYNDGGRLQRACDNFLRRIGQGEIYGYTSTLVVSEVTHRIIVAEARKQGVAPQDRTVEYLQKHPDAVRLLTEHLQVASDIGNFGVDILPVTVRDLHASKHYRATFGLMANDSLIAAVMQNANIADLATHDAGFDTVQTLRAWGLASP